MIYNAMDRLHPNIVKQHVLNMGFEAGLTGFKKVKENREKYGCNVPWVKNHGGYRIFLCR